MVATQFRDLVKSLRDEYLRGVEIREKEKGRLPIGERLTRDLAMERGMLPLGTESFFEFYLHPEGRLLFYNTLVEEVWEQRDDPWSLALGLRIGSRQYPELQTLLPSSNGSAECVACAGAGQVSRDSETAACWDCHGLGWLPVRLADLCEAMSAEFRSASGDLPQLTALARRFFMEGSADFGMSRAGLTYLEVVLRRAGLDREQVGEICEVAEPYLDEVRQRDAPCDVSQTRVPWLELDDPPWQTNACTMRGQPFTGVAYSTFEDGSLCDEWTTRSGLLWGPNRSYWPEGRLMSSGYFVARIRHGVWREWYRDGGKQSIETIQFGVTVRKKQWNKKGEVTSDSLLDSESTAEWHRSQLLANQRKFGALIEAEQIPEEFMRVSEVD